MRAGKRAVPSLVWLVPAIAAAVALMLLIQALQRQGPEITITFRSAAGITPGKTAVRYRSVEIGVVKAVRMAPDRSHVTATIDLTRDAADFAAKDSRFWVVRPRVAPSGVSGMETLLAGAYIGVDAGKSPARSRSFTGLEVPPPVTSDASGRQFVLHASDLGSLDVGSPIFYRRVRVGQVTAYEIDPDGRDLTVRVFVNAPYDRLVTADTRFWHASGIDIKLDAAGVRLSTQGVATMLLGGVAFQTPEHSTAKTPAEEHTSFRLAGDSVSAFKSPDELAPTLAVLNFDQSVRGLAVGAPVDFRGIVVGQVRSISVEYRADTRAFRMPVVVELYPSRIGLAQRDLGNKQKGRSIADAMNRRGLRAQLRTGNLLTGQLYIAFDFFPQAPPASPDLEARLPELPTIPGTFDTLQTQLASILNKVDKVPFDRIGQDLRTTLATMNRLLVHADTLTTQLDGDVLPQVIAALKDARQTMKVANGVLDAGAPLQQDTRRLVQELTRTAISLRHLTDYLERHPEAVVRGKPSPDAP